MSFATALAYWSGLAFVAPNLPPATVLGTALVLHDAARALARRRGITGAHLTISHAGALAVAVVVLERRAAAAATAPRRRARPRSR